MGTDRQSKIDNRQSGMGRVRVRCLGVIGDWVGVRRLQVEGEGLGRGTIHVICD